jgi:hypothetical protein
VTWLTDGPVTARWYERNGPPPEPGPTMVRGSLVGTVHDDGLRITGTIQRIRFATATYRLIEPRRLEPVPGTLALTDVAEAPRSLFFTFDSEGEGRRNAQGADEPKSVGVLLDMTVP